jgi:hypothetical protein
MKILIKYETSKGNFIALVDLSSIIAGDYTITLNNDLVIERDKIKEFTVLKDDLSVDSIDTVQIFKCLRLTDIESIRPSKGF